MQIRRLQELLQRLLTDPPAGLDKPVPVAGTRYDGHRQLGRYDLVTHCPNRAALDQWVRGAVEAAEHPEITGVGGYDTDNEWFGRDGVELTFTDGSHGHVRFLPAPGDTDTLIVRLFGSAPPGGDAAADDRDGTPEKTREWEERWRTALTAAPM